MCTLLTSLGCITRTDLNDSDHAAAESFRTVLNGSDCRWAAIREQFGEESPWMAVDGSTQFWKWKQRGKDGERRCHHCDNCEAAAAAEEEEEAMEAKGATEAKGHMPMPTPGMLPATPVEGRAAVHPSGEQTSIGLVGSRGRGVAVECSAAVRVLLAALRESLDEAPSGRGVSWTAVQRKLQAHGSRLTQLVSSVPRPQRRKLHALLVEVLALRTEWVDRRTCRPPKYLPYDVFVLTPRGRSYLATLEGVAQLPPLWLRVPYILHLHPRAHESGEADDSDAMSDDDDVEENDTRRVHDGYTGAIHARPTDGTPLAKGERVAVYFTAPHLAWYEGVVSRAAAVGSSVQVRFDDGVFVVRLSATRHGRFGMWVRVAAERDEEWAGDGHDLLGRACICEGYPATLRMWCARSRRFVAWGDDEKHEFEMSEAEAAVAVENTRSEEAIAVGTHEPPEPLDASADTEADDSASEGTGALDEGLNETVPWPLRWELERARLRSGREPSKSAVEAICDDWENSGEGSHLDEARDAECASGGARAEEESNLRVHRQHVSSVRRHLDQPLVMPYAPAGYVVKYRVRVREGGAIEMGEPRKDVRTLAHSLFGEAAWLYVELDELPEEDPARKAERTAQARVLREGLVVCGRKFVFFGFKVGRSMNECVAYFIARSGALADASCYERRSGLLAEHGWAWDGAASARGLLAAFESMASLPKLCRRLALPFSGTQPALRGYTCRVFDHRGSVSAFLPLVPTSPLRRVAPGSGRLVHVHIVDDLRATSGSHIMTDGAGLISLNLAKALPSVSEGLPSEGGTDAFGGGSAGDGLAALGTQMRLYAHGGLAKGMLLTSRSLPRNVVILTASQV
jgi:hypothetical protein